MCADGFGLNYTLPTFEVFKRKDIIPKLIPPIPGDGTCQRKSKLGIPPGRRIFRLKDCLSKPCKYGWCEETMTDYMCHCRPGYTGKDCGTEIDNCSMKPCVHGTCVDGDSDDSFYCTCISGWTGEFCDQDIDDCSEDPCHHGTCVDGIDVFNCTCAPGWTGEFCDHDVDECSSAVCLHGGTCTNHNGSFECSCTKVWTGNFCETNIDECSSNPCEYGQCVDGNATFTCNCQEGWTGPLCEFDSSHWYCSTAKCYSYSLISIGWETAREYCANPRVYYSYRVTRNASLLFVSEDAEIRTLDERWDFHINGNHWCVWINCSDRDEEGSFVCETDAEGSLSGPKTTNWAPGEPDGGSHENCVAVGTKMKWYDERCSWSCSIVCQITLNQ